MKKFKINGLVTALALMTVISGCSAGDKQSASEQIREQTNRHTASSADREEDFYEETDEDTSSPAINILDKYELGTYGGEKISWIVIDTDGDKALLLSEKMIEGKPYDDTKKDVTWETCSLRKWLNEDFYGQAFTSEEKQMILKTTVNNRDLPKEGNNYGNDTVDYIYILNSREMKDAEASISKFAKAGKTQYAKDNALKLTSDYWRRDPGTNSKTKEVSLRDMATVRGSDGNLNFHCSSNHITAGVRPAMWVDIEMLTQGR